MSNEKELTETYSDAELIAKKIGYKDLSVGTFIHGYRYGYEALQQKLTEVCQQLEKSNEALKDAITDVIYYKKIAEGKNPF